MESALRIIKKAVEYLDDGPITDSKLMQYADVKSALESISKAQQYLFDEEIFNLVYNTTKTVIYLNCDAEELILDILNLLFKCKSKDFVIKEIPEAYIRMAFSDIQKDTKMYENATILIHSYFKELVMTNSLNIENIMIQINVEKRTEVITKLKMICLEVEPEEGRIFFYENLINTIITTNNSQIRNDLINLAFEILPNFSVTSLEVKQLNTFMENIKSSYTQKIMELKAMKDPNWQNILMLLIKCCGKILHSNVDVTNSLLKVIENAFRSKFIEEKSTAYDCWKVLIDNYSLDVNLLCSTKQIKLIVTPLKTKLTKNDLMVYKKFDVWLHLLNILKEKFAIYLEHFLQFCICLFNDELPISVNKSVRHPKNKLTQMQKNITEVLLIILGHYGHNSKSSCIEGESILGFDGPILNTANFKNFDNIITCVGKCSLNMVLYVNKQDIKQVIKCLWGSLFQLISKLPENEYELVLPKITLELVHFNELSQDGFDYFEHIFKNILELLHKGFFSVEILNKTATFSLVKSFLTRKVPWRLSEKKAITDLITYGKTTPNKIAFLNEVVNVLHATKVEDNVNNVIIFWIECENIVFDIYKSSIKEVNQLTELTKSLEQFMIWPLEHISKISLDKLCTRFVEKWGALFDEMFSTFNDISLLILTNILNNIKTKTTLGSNICVILRIFRPLIFKYKTEKLFSVLVNLIYEILKLPNLTQMSVDILLSVVVVLMNNVSEQNDEITFKGIVKCTKILIVDYERLKLLRLIERFVSVIPINIKDEMTTLFIEMLETLSIHNDDKVRNKVNSTLKVLKRFIKKEIIKDVFVSNESLIIPSQNESLLNIANETEKLRDTTSVLQLFGKDVISTIRGSQLNKKHKLTTNKPKNVIMDSKKTSSFVDNDHDDYVLIDEEYQFDLKRLSDHQIEIFKSRKCDIPALYQDLSQSQSNSQFLIDKSNSLSRINIKGSDDLNLMEKDGNSNIKKAKASIPLSNDDNNDTKLKKRNEINNLSSNITIADNLVVQLEKSGDITNTVSNNLLQTMDWKIENNLPQKQANNATEKTILRIDENIKYLQEKDPKKLRKVQKELNKIKINIVGGDEIIQNLNLAENKIHTRGKVNPILRMKRKRKSSTSNKDNIKVPTKKQNLTFSKVANCQESTKHHAETSENIESQPNPIKVVSTNLTTHTEKLEETKQKADIYTENLSLFANKSEISNDLNVTPHNESKLIVQSDFQHLNENYDLTTVGLSYSQDIIDSSEESGVSSYRDTSKLYSSLNDTPTGLDTVRSQANELSMDTNIRVINNDVHVSQNTAEMDTETQHTSDFSCKPLYDIPSSPIHYDTLTKASELMNNTFDISPIKLTDKINNISKENNLASEDHQFIAGNIIPIILIPNSEDNTSLSLDVTNEISSDSPPQFEKFQKLVNDCDIDNLKKDIFSSETILINLPMNNTEINIAEKKTTSYSSRSAKLLNLIPCTSIVKNKKTYLTNKTQNKVRFPQKTQRIVRMLENCGKKTEPKITINVTPIKESNQNATIDVLENNLLRFVRVLPSPLALPKVGILKRKAPEYNDDGLSPPRKKRVNFCDPPLTCEKVFIKDEDEHTKYTTKSYADVLFAVAFDNRKGTSNDSELTNIETNVINESSDKCRDLTENGVPIYADLIDCKEELICILNSIVNMASKETLVVELENRNIFTIGDLAKLSEQEIKELSFKEPKVTVVYEVLHKYCEDRSSTVKEIINSECISITTDITVQSEAIQTGISDNDTMESQNQPKLENQKLDIKMGFHDSDEIIPKMISTTETLNIKVENYDLTAFSEDFERLKEECLKQGIGCFSLSEIVIKSLGFENAILTLKENNALNLKEYVSENDWSVVLNEIITSVGYKKFVYHLCSTNNIEDFIRCIFENLDSITINSIQKQKLLDDTVVTISKYVSLTSILKQFNATDVIKEICKLCNDIQYPTSKIVESAFSIMKPNIDELIPSFPHITVVNLNNKVLDRSSSNAKSLSSFIQQILKYTERFEDNDLTKNLQQYYITNLEREIKYLPKVKPNNDTLKPLVFNLFDKIPMSSILRYCSEYINKNSENT